MAVKKAADGRSWMFDVRDPNRKRIRKKGFATEAEALEAVTILKRYWFRRKHNLPTKGGATVINFPKELEYENVDGIINLPNELKVEAEYMRSRSVDYKTKHYRFIAITIEKYAAMLPPKLDIRDFGRKHLNQFQDFESDRRLKPDTVNLYLRYLRSALVRIKRRYVDELDDWQIPEDFYLESEKITRTKVISDLEISKLLNILEDPPPEANIMPKTIEIWQDAADVLLIGVLSGMRKTEIVSLEWTTIYFERKFFRVKTLKQKGRREIWREVPLEGELLEIFERRKAVVCDSRFIFTQWEKDKQSQWLYRAWKKACELANIPYGTRISGGIFPHATRHTAATMMLVGGADLKTTADVLGISSEELLRTYAHTTMKSKRKALASLNVKRIKT